MKRSDEELDEIKYGVWGCSLRVEAAIIKYSRYLLRLQIPNPHNSTTTQTANMAPSMDMTAVTAILILNSEDGSRVFAKYYSAPHKTSAHGHSMLSAPSIPSPDHFILIFFAAAPVGHYPDLKTQKAFEKGLLEKTAKQTADIILYDNRIVLYKSESDVMMYVVGGVDENEIMLYNVILSLRDSLHLLFKYALPPSLHLYPASTSPRRFGRHILFNRTWLII